MKGAGMSLGRFRKCLLQFAGGAAMAPLFILVGNAGEAHAATANYQGFVSDTYGAPIEGVRVDIVANDNVTVVDTKTTDILGGFSFTLPQSIYNIHYLPQPGMLYEAASRNFNGFYPVDLSVQLRAAVPQYTLSGYVYDRDGRPIPQVALEFSAPNTYPDGFSHDQVGVGTDQNGYYSVTVDQSVGDSLSVKGCRCRTTLSSFPFIFLVDGTTFDATENRTLDIHLDAAEITLHVVDPFGNPVSHAQVFADSSASNVSSFLFDGASPAFVHGDDSGITAGTPGNFTNSDGVAKVEVFKFVDSVVMVNSPNALWQTYRHTVHPDTTNGQDLYIQLQFALGVPGNLTTASPVHTAPVLAWDTASGADHYNVYRDGALVGSSTTTTYTDSNLSVDGTYSYTVTAVAANNTESARSGPVTVVFDQTPPALGSLNWSVNPMAVGATTTLSLPVSDAVSGVQRVEYFVDTDPGQGNAIQMAFVNGQWAATFGSNLTPGIYTVSVRAQDAAGNWSAVSSSYLVVYDPNGLKMQGKNDVLLPVAGTDVLPGLISVGQTDKAKVAFLAEYNSGGTINQSKSDFKFEYHTGTKCGKAQAVNCHDLVVNGTSIDWLVVNGTNNSNGTFQGMAAVTVDGVTTSNPYRVEGLDSTRLGSAASDHLTVKIFAVGADPSTATPLYQVSADVSKGDVKIY